MRLLFAMMIGCCAMVGYAQEGAPEEVVTAEETGSEGQEAAPAEAKKEAPTSGGCGCGKPKVF